MSPGQEPPSRSRSTRSRRSRRVRRRAARPGARAPRRGSPLRRAAERARPRARRPLAPPVLLGRRRHTATGAERACSNCESRLRRRPAARAPWPVPSPRPRAGNELRLHPVSHPAQSSTSDSARPAHADAARLSALVGSRDCTKLVDGVLNSGRRRALTARRRRSGPRSALLRRGGLALCSVAPSPPAAFRHCGP